jgi:hypothetical protein
MLVFHTICWALVGYFFLGYAVVKLYFTLFGCPPGEGYNLNGCAQIPWHCQDSTMYPDTARCILCATGFRSQGCDGV